MKAVYFLVVVLSLLLASCGPYNNQQNTTNGEKTQNIYTHVPWSKDANIYEVNIRQYTPEGTFDAFATHLPRLKAMGVDILWIMPINPIGEINRKGTMGSYYAVKDYQLVNPEFGTLDSFKAMVNKAHELGMYVIIDWVANHTSWDNWLISDHPDWYTKDSLGAIVPPVADWSDVADLNYDNSELNEYMAQSMEYWVKETNIDGYRCDVAGMVPMDFWLMVRPRLDAIKHVFMLAEWESKEALSAFDMIYGWELHHILNKIAQGEMNATNLTAYFEKIDTVLNQNDFVMNFITNHDENSWNGTEFERMGNAIETMATLIYTVPGLPLIYSGQEAKLNKRLSFFEKDTINWENYGYAEFYTALLKLKKENKALWNGNWGGKMVLFETNNPNIFAFMRRAEQNTVMAIFNLSPEKQTFEFENEQASNMFVALSKTSNAEKIITLDSWDYQLLIEK